MIGEDVKGEIWEVQAMCQNDSTYRGSLAWSSVLLALRNIKKVGKVVDRPKALGDIRGVTYIYGMFYRFGLIDVPDEVKRRFSCRTVDGKYRLGG